MKKNILKTRTKIEAVAVGLLLISIVIGSVWATRTITDTGDTWTGTMMISGNTDFKSGSYYNLSRKIYTSTGRVYNATGANLQLAIWNLNSTSGGTVWIPSGTLTLSTVYTARSGGTWNNTVRIEPGVTLQGAGINVTTLKIANGCGAVEIISAYNCHNFSIKDLSINGNAGGAGATQTTLIGIDECEDFLLENLYCYAPLKEGIDIDDSTRGKLNKLWLNDVGLGNAYQHLVLSDSDKLQVDNIFIRSNGVKADTEDVFGLDANTLSWSQINNLHITGTGMGFKLVDACHNLTFNSLFVSGITNNTQNGAINFGPNGCYDISFNNVNIQSAFQGMNFGSTAQRMQFNNVVIRGGADSGVYSSGDFLSFNNMQICSGSGYAMYLVGCDDSKFSNVEVYKCAGGVYFENNDRTSFVNCKFEGSTSGSTGYGIVAKSSTYWSVLGSYFIDNALDGIDTTITSCNNYTISYCFFKGNGQAIDLHASDNYIIISNNICYGDSIDMVTNTTTAICYNNIAQIT